MTSTPDYTFRIAQTDDMEHVMEIVRSAQRRLALTGSDQWQNGYPNRESIGNDVARGYGRVLCDVTGAIVAYGALLYDGESAYDAIRDGEWLTPSSTPYLTIHRLCVAKSAIGTGCGRRFMLAAEREATPRCHSIRVDTHPKNIIMQQLLHKLSYHYCGIVEYESPRWAYELLLCK